VKGLKIRADLEALGISSELTRQIRCPMGIDISNSNHPAEIAVSIVAELIQTRRGSEKPLSET
jgi:xanthine/CO dehydrogenase XdhC/CoxF family maturation factor